MAIEQTTVDQIARELRLVRAQIKACRANARAQELALLIAEDSEDRLHRLLQSLGDEMGVVVAASPGGDEK